MPNKPCYLRNDIFIKACKMENFSKVVNDLLEDYFNSDKYSKMTKEELLEARRVSLIEMEALNKIENGYNPEIQNG